MNPDDTARLVYLSLLGGAVLMWFFAQNRASWGKVTQQAIIWGLIFIGVVAAAGLWSDIQRSIRPEYSVSESGQIRIPRAEDGHYYLTAEVNNAKIRFVIDTGATQIVLTRDDAEAAGIDTGSLVYFGRANTANGEVRTASVRLDRFAIGPVEDFDIRALVNSGEMNGSLLGMSYLQEFSSMEFRNGELLLTR